MCNDHWCAVHIVHNWYTLCTNWYLCEPRNTIDTNGQQMAPWLCTRHSPRWASILPRAFSVQPMKEKCQIWLKSLACSSVPENISVLHTWEGIWCPHTLWLVCFSSSSCSILCWKLDTKETRFHTETRKSREINQFSKVLISCVLPENYSSPPLYWWWDSVWRGWRSART